MKRLIPLFVVLVTALSIALYLRLRQQRLEAERPSGGSATVEGTQIDVVSRLPGRITAIHVAAGDTVEPGQVLVEIDCAEQQALLAQADAALAGAKVALEAAKKSVHLSEQGVRSAASQAWMAQAAAEAAKAQRLAVEAQRGAAERAADRIKKVYEAGGLPDQTMDQTEAQAEGLDHQLEAASANVKAAQAQSQVALSAQQAAHIKGQLVVLEIRGVEQKVKAAEAARARAAIAVSECTLKAPRGGYVLERNFEPGEVVLPGSRVLTLVDIDRVKATFYLPNAELGAAEPGRAVELRADTYPDRVFEGEILRVGTEAEFTPRNVQTREDRDRLVYAVEVEVANPEALLRPGMPVEITVVGTGHGE